MCGRGNCDGSCEVAHDKHQHCPVCGACADAAVECDDCRAEAEWAATCPDAVDEGVTR